MDHREATRIMASEKYLLNELSQAEVEAFEEHLFECQDCALDVRSGSLFLERSKVELANASSLPAPFPPLARERSAWFSWLRPAFAIPAMSILLLVVGYQNLVIYPALKEAVAENGAPTVLPAAALVSGATRGAVPAAIAVRPGEAFLLPLDIQRQSSFQSYVIQLQNPAGGVQWSLPVSAESANNTLAIRAPGVEKAGRYEVIVTGRDTQGQSSEVGRYPFELQFAAAAKE